MWLGSTELHVYSLFMYMYTYMYISVHAHHVHCTLYLCHVTVVYMHIGSYTISSEMVVPNCVQCHYYDKCTIIWCCVLML